MGQRVYMLYHNNILIGIFSNIRQVRKIQNNYNQEELVLNEIRINELNTMRNVSRLLKDVPVVKKEKSILTEEELKRKRELKKEKKEKRKQQKAENLKNKPKKNKEKYNKKKAPKIDKPVNEINDKCKEISP